MFWPANNNTWRDILDIKMPTSNTCCDILSLGAGAIVWSLIDLVWAGPVFIYVIANKIELEGRGLSIFGDHLISEASVVLIHLSLDYFIYYISDSIP